MTKCNAKLYNIRNIIYTMKEWQDLFPFLKLSINVYPKKNCSDPPPPFVELSCILIFEGTQTKRICWTRSPTFHIRAERRTQPTVWHSWGPKYSELTATDRTSTTRRLWSRTADRPTPPWFPVKLCKTTSQGFELLWLVSRIWWTKILWSQSHLLHSRSVLNCLTSTSAVW